MQEIAREQSRLRPEMPLIPGVNDGVGRGGEKRPFWTVILVAAGLLAAAGIGWRVAHGSRREGPKRQAAEQDKQTTSASPETRPASAHAAGPSTAATVAELSTPWAAKKFTFVDPLSHENIPAMIVRLPAGAGAGYWAFSLNAPYETCQLEYMTDLNRLASRYGYRAKHPMVVSECDGTVYDPLGVATVQSRSWVRGEVVAGSGLRPPLSINARIQGQTLVADRIE